MNDLDNVLVKELKNTIDVISILQLRGNTLREDLDFFNAQNKDYFGVFAGALMRLEHEVMFLCIDTFSLHQGISEQRSLYRRIIKQNGKALCKVNKSPSADKEILIHLGIFTTDGKREATCEEIDCRIREINESDLESRKILKDSVGITSHENSEMDEWWNTILDKNAVESISQYRNIFAHRLNSLENLKKALDCNTPESISELLNVISIVLNGYQSILQKILGYKELIYYEGYKGLVYDSLSRIKQYEELVSNNG